MANFDTDLYPKTTVYTPFAGENEAERALEREKSELELNKTLYEKVLEHLDEQIEFLGSLESIEVDGDSTGEEVLRQIAVSKRLATVLKSEKGFIEDLIKQHIK